MKNEFENKWASYVSKFKTVFKENLLQSAIYNTDMEKGNLCLILKENNYSNFEELNHLFKEIKKAKLPVPLIFSKKYILSSLDSFPLEFLNIKAGYKSLFEKEDVLAEISPEKKNVRLQIERDLKSQWLHSESNFIENYKKKKILLKLLKASMSSIIPILEGLLFLKEIKVPKEREKLIKICDEKTEFSIKSFEKAYYIIIEKRKPDLEELQKFFVNYLKQIAELSNYIDIYKEN